MYVSFLIISSMLPVHQAVFRIAQHPQPVKLLPYEKNSKAILRQTDEIILSFFQFNNVNYKAHFMRIYAA